MAARDGVRRRKYLLSPPMWEANKSKSETNKAYGLCYVGPRQGWEHIYERAGGRTGTFIWKQIYANLKLIMRLTAHSGWAAS